MGRATFDRSHAGSLTVKAIFQTENVSVSSFYRWKKSLAQTQAMPALAGVDFLSPASDKLDLVLPGGATVKLNEAAIQKVIAAMIAATDVANEF